MAGFGRQPSVADAPVLTAQARLEALFEGEFRVVYGFVRARVGASEAEDVTADVFRAAAERLRAEPSCILGRSWLLTAARNRIIDRWRHRRRWAGRLEVLRRDVDGTADRTAGESADRVLEALDRLPDEQRIALILRYVDGCSSREIGDATGRSAAAVDSLLARARRGLSAAVRKEVP
jgi:RNA polymerase sigma-70 factor, ECF subfamily